jgi:uncharacterized protein (TIGR03437 family)
MRITGILLGTAFLFAGGLVSAATNLSLLERLPLVFEDHGDAFLARSAGYSLQVDGPKSIIWVDGNRIGATLPGANPEARGVGLEATSGSVNYFLGDDARQWKTGIPSYHRVRYNEVYPGIDLIYYGNQGRLEFDFVVSAHADPSLIAMQFDGAGELTIGDEGDLLLHPPSGVLRFEKPLIYQERSGYRVEVAGRYVIREDETVVFEVADYDPSRELVIDPVVSFSTFFGGKGNDTGMQVAVGPLGNIYMGGVSTGDGFPITSGVVQPNFAGMGPLIITAGDAFVAKFTADGELVYSTYLGGTDDDAVMGMAVDAEGNAYLGGITKSSNFPTTPGAAQTAYGGVGKPIHTGGDGYLSKISADGKTLIYSTFIGGNDGDTVLGVAVTGNGVAYVTGQSLSPNFPTTTGAFQTAYRGDGKAEVFKTGDAFVAQVASDGSSFVYSTLLGGTSDETGAAIAVTAEGNAVITGFTNSTDFPVTADPIQGAFGGLGGQLYVVYGDAFVTKLSPDGSSLVYSTYLGGTLDEMGYDIALDSIGCAYVTGSTLSANFPVTEGAFQTTYGGAGGETFWSSGDVFVTKINETGEKLLYSTFIGGTLDDRAFGIAVDSKDRAIVTGNTLSTDYPVTEDAFSKTNAGSGGHGLSSVGDVLVTRLNAAGSALNFSTYIGGDRDDLGKDVAVDAHGGLVITGATVSSNWQTNADAFSRAYSGALDNVLGAATGDAVLFKIKNDLEIVTLSSASFALDAPVAAESLVTGFAPDVAPEVAVTSSTDLPSQLLGATVDVTDGDGTTRRAGLHSVTPTQVSYEVPAGTVNGTATVLLTNSDGVEIAGTVEVATVAPGIYAANAQGTGVAAAFFLLVDSESNQTQEIIFDPTTRAAVPVSLGAETDQVFLIIFGTGMRAGSTATATINGVEVPLAGPLGHPVFPGLDQVNLGPIPRSLLGSGLVDIQITVDGIPANIVQVQIR